MADRRLSDESQSLLDALEQVRSLERQKRKEQISSPEFHRLADAVDEASREIFRIASDERATGERLETEERTIEDIAPLEPRHPGHDDETASPP